MIPTDEANEGAMRVGAAGGGPAGGIQVGLGPKERARSAGSPAVPPPAEQAVRVLASKRNWQTNCVAYPGWLIPRSNQTALHHPIVSGHVPARTLADGGWIDIHADGVYKTNGSANPTLVAKVLFNGAYFGPSWAGGIEQGWGWWGQDPANEDLDPSTNYNFTFFLRVKSLGWGGAKDAEDNTCFWKLEGHFELWTGTYDHSKNEDNQGGGDFVMTRRLIREHMAVVDPARDLEVVLTMGNPRPDGGGTTATGDSMHVHGSDILLYCPLAGQESGPGHLAVHMGAN